MHSVSFITIIALSEASSSHSTAVTSQSGSGDTKRRRCVSPSSEFFQESAAKRSNADDARARNAANTANAGRSNAATSSDSEQRTASNPAKHADSWTGFRSAEADESEADESAQWESETDESI